MCAYRDVNGWMIYQACLFTNPGSAAFPIPKRDIEHDPLHLSLGNGKHLFMQTGQRPSVAIVHHCLIKDYAHLFTSQVVFVLFTLEVSALDHFTVIYIKILCTEILRCRYFFFCKAWAA